MKLIPDSLIFEWDEGNVKKNELQHRVSVTEIEQAFCSILYVFSDEKHSGKEQRHGVYAVTVDGRKLAIVFTRRKDAIRVIMARDMSRKERADYEKFKKNTSL